MDVLNANIELHSRMANRYNEEEPHFRPENQKYVQNRLKAALSRSSASQNETPRLLDLGCGTGFMIQLAKPFVSEITGVDATRAMMNRVDASGPAKIELIEADLNHFEPRAQYYDAVTAYSVLHHLPDWGVTLSIAFKALKSDGFFYADLEPNGYFWQGVQQVASRMSSSENDAIKISEDLMREVGKLTQGHEEVAVQLGVQPALLHQAEPGKSAKGGLIEEEIVAAAKQAGFSRVEIIYRWFLGQARLNRQDAPASLREASQQLVDQVLQQALPLSRPLFKYVGFVAWK